MNQRGTSEFALRSARPGDGAAMRDLARRAYGVYVERIGREPAPMNSDYDQVAISGDALLVWLGDTLAAMLVTRAQAGVMFVENLAVSPDFSNRGLGSALLLEAERSAARDGLSEIRLYTNEAMTENLAYYARRGYHETRRRVSDGFRRVHFAKRLDPSH